MEFSFFKGQDSKVSHNVIATSCAKTCTHRVKQTSATRLNSQSQSFSSRIKTSKDTAERPINVASESIWGVKANLLKRQLPARVKT